MNESQPSTSAPDATNTEPSLTTGEPCGAAHAGPCGIRRHPRRHRRRGFLLGLLVGVIGTGLVGFAIGATLPAAEAAMGAAHRGHGGPPTEAQAVERAEFVVSFALHRLDASEEQETRVQEIVGGAIGDLYPIVEIHRGNRDRLRSILAAPTIDRSAIERLRVEEMGLADEMSRVVVAALTDTAEVLTNEQREELLRHLERFRHHD